MAESTFARLPAGYVIGSLPVKYSFWTSITKSARFGFPAIKLIVGQRKKWRISAVVQNASNQKSPQRFEALTAEIHMDLGDQIIAPAEPVSFSYPLMENRLGLKYLAWPTRRIQSISSGVIGPFSSASSAAVRSDADLGPVRQRSTAGFVKLNR